MWRKLSLPGHLRLIITTQLRISGLYRNDWEWIPAALNMSDPQTMSALMSSIIQHENGRNIYSRELINKAAVAGISGKMTEVNQQNTYHIYGGGDPHAVGNEVARRQQSANAQVMRSNQVRVG